MSIKKYDLQDDDLMTAAEASKRWGYDAGYVRQMRTKYPEKIPEGEIRMFGKTLVITKEGMEKLTGKKEKRVQYLVVEEENWSIIDQKEVSDFEEGKEELKRILLKNMERIRINEMKLDYIDARKQKFGMMIYPGRCFYIIAKNV